MSKANKTREDAGLAAKKELLAREKSIREEAAPKAYENFNTKIREQLTATEQVAEQGAQQLQGEILELDVEQNLRTAFSFDTVEEVKKGERGSDIRQAVNEKSCQNCGLILWECKNAKTYQANWLSKLKDELAVEKTQIRMIAFNPTDGNGDDYKQLAENIWPLSPATPLCLPLSCARSFGESVCRQSQCRG